MWVPPIYVPEMVSDLLCFKAHLVSGQIQSIPDDICAKTIKLSNQTATFACHRNHRFSSTEVNWSMNERGHDEEALLIEIMFSFVVSFHDL